MYRKQGRNKTIVSLALTVAMAVMTVCPVMGGEVTADFSAGVPVEGSLSNGVTAEETAGPDHVFMDEDPVSRLDSAEAELDSESTYYGYNTSPSANTYCGIIYVRDDGLYDHWEEGKGKKLDIPGISYDPSTYTMELNNVNIGCVFDGPLNRDKRGVLCFCLNDKKGISVNDPSYGNQPMPIRDIKVVLKGHNYLGGYSTFERRNVFYVPDHSFKEIPFIGTEIDGCIFRAYDSIMPRLIFEGDGDIMIHGYTCGSANVDVRIYTNLPLWYSNYNTDFRRATEEDLTLNLVSPYYFPAVYDQPRNKPYYVLQGPRLNYDWSLVRDEGSQLYYVKIGGNEPDTYETGQCNITASKNLGVFDGHSVSVCYTDRVVYGGIPHTLTCINDDDAKKKTVDDMEIQVYIDGKLPNNNPIAPDMNLDFDGKRYFRPSFLNNTDSSEVSLSKGKEPCFSFEFSKNFFRDYGEYSGVANEIKEYFKDKKNWIRFTIVPCDIKYADSTFYGLEKSDTIGTTIDDITVYPKARVKKREKRIRKNIKTKGDSINKINLWLYIFLKTKGRNNKTIEKKLKWDKKYNESSPNLKKDFHASVSGDCIVITGQGNYTGTVIVTNPLKTDYRYYQGVDDEQ